MEKIHKKWLADYRVESSLKLDPKEKKLIYIHPKKTFEIHISDEPDGNRKNEALSVQIIVSAPDIQSAEEITQAHLEKFLHMLSFVTSMGYKISRRICLIDWTPGISQRELFQYSDKLEQPIERLLASDLLETTNLLHTWEASEVLEMGLRWYAAGVRSKIMEDQFQFFWFVIELIADSTSDVKKVTDKCQKCRGDLHCKSCNELSTHKPFSKQLIEHLLSRTGLSEDKIKDLFLVRNKLLHGTSRQEIEKIIQEKSSGFSFDKAVDLLGKTSWTAILNSFKKPDGKYQPKFLAPSTFVDWHMTAKAHMILGIGGDPNNPQIENVSLPQVSISSRD